MILGKPLSKQHLREHLGDVKPAGIMGEIQEDHPAHLRILLTDDQAREVVKINEYNQK